MKTLKISAYCFFILFFSQLFFSPSVLSAQIWHAETAAAETTKIPSGLTGIWQGSDRFLLFTPANDNGTKPDVSLMLKTLYDWYYDRCAEPECFSEYPRDLNSVTGKESVKLSADFSKISLTDESASDGAWEISLTFQDKSNARIPVARVGNNLYLDFLVKYIPEQSDLLNQADPAAEENPLYGAWLGVGVASGITANAPYIQKELTSAYITHNSIYYIRYWQTDMEYSPLMATFSDGEQDFYIPKHIKSAGKIYTCVSGRSLQIRNVTRSPLVTDDFILDSSGKILVYSKPYLTLLESSTGDEKDIELYMHLAKDANSRRKPDPPPLFPPDNLNWHWKEINELEKNNAQIQAVRRRQREFAAKKYARQAQAE